MSGARSRRRARCPTAAPNGGDARIIPLCPIRETALPERRPLVVTLDDAGCASALAELAGAGWTVVGTGAPAGPTECVRHRVAGCDDAQAVVVAAVRGDAVLAVVRPGRDAEPGLDTIADDLVEDLRSLGAALLVDATNAVPLDVDGWRLAHEIARGTTLDSAARLLNLSPRTANRRLGAARQALGADSRAQLVHALRAPGRVPPAVTGR